MTRALIGTVLPGCTIIDPCDPLGEILTVSRGGWVGTVNLSQTPEAIVERVHELAATYEIEIAYRKRVDAVIAKQYVGNVRKSAKALGHGEP